MRNARRRRSPPRTGALARLALLLVAPLLLLAVRGEARGRDLVVAATGEAAVQQPMIVLGIGDRPPDPGPSTNALEDLGVDLPAVAVLDTGASGHVLSRATAARFGVEAEPGARYFETSMSGDHAMQVSRSLTLAASDLDPTDGDAPRGRRPRAATYRLASQRFLLNDAPADLGALLLSPGAMVDVVGMPLIRERVVELVPGEADAAAGAVAVRLHPSAAGLGVDGWIPFALTDFNRRDPRNRGPRPSLAENPLVEDVRVALGAKDAEGAWLLDTGAACTMISTEIARGLGLVDGAGAPTRRPEFTLPVGGTGGGHTTLPGFRLDRLTLATDDDRALVFERPAVVVHDITTTMPDGSKLTLDGVFGMNLLLPSGTGMTMLGAARQLPSPFARIVIDARGERLGVKLR